MTFKELRKIRIEKGLTQAELAEIVGINKYRVSDLECGRRKASFMEIDKIKEVLGVKDVKRKEKVITVDDCKGCVYAVEDSFIFADGTNTVRCERNNIFLCFSKNGNWIIEKKKLLKCNFGG